MRRVRSASARASASTLAFFGSLPSGEASTSRSSLTKTWACCTAASLRPMRADAGDDARLEEGRLDRDRSLPDQAGVDQHRVAVLALVEVEAGQRLEHVPPALLAADALELLVGALGRADVAVGADVVLAGLLHQGELAVLRHRGGGHLAEEDHRPEQLQRLAPVAEVVVDPALLVEGVAVDRALLVLGRVLVRLQRPLQVLVPLVLVGPLEVVLAEGHPAVGDEARLGVVLDQGAVGLERLGVVPVALLEVLRPGSRAPRRGAGTWGSAG